MEVYILDSLLRRIDVVDVFVSLIWTDRMRAVGDFELVLSTSTRDKSRFAIGTRLAMSESDRIMVVETVEDSTDDQGLASLKITGRSLEKMLDDRLARGALTDLTTEPKWILTGTPGDIARQIFHDICVTGTLDTGDIIPFIVEGSIMPVDTIPEPVDSITYEIEPQTVYAALVTICTQFNMGFRILRNGDASQIYFDIYMGSDRTTDQTDLPAVVFSPGLDNLVNTSELTSIALFKNVAYVLSPVGFEVVYPLDVDPSVAGFERSVLLVKADDITDVDSGVASAKMIQRGLQELAKARRVSAFDGELSQQSQFREGRDYYLGDLIEVRSTTGATDQMQVTEQIYVSDNQGERAYPTLTLYSFITPGTWAALPTDQVWVDLDPDLDWRDWT